MFKIEPEIADAAVKQRVALGFPIRFCLQFWSHFVQPERESDPPRAVQSSGIPVALVPNKNCVIILNEKGTVKRFFGKTATIYEIET